MRLKVREQILISAVSTDVLRPGQSVEVDDATAAALHKSHPAYFKFPEGFKPAEAVVEPQAKAEAPVLNKRAAPLQNKAE